METNQTQMQNMLNTAVQENAAVQPQQPQQTQQPAQQEEQLALQLRAQELIAQAHTIQAITGVDVLAVYNTDAEVRTRVLNGEMDFIDLWKSMKVPSTPPAPVRSANGGVGAMNINAMNESQFDKLNEMLSRGVKVDMR